MQSRDSKDVLSIFSSVCVCVCVCRGGGGGGGAGRLTSCI